VSGWERLTAVIVVCSFQTMGLVAATAASAFPTSGPPGEPKRYVPPPAAGMINCAPAVPSFTEKA